MNIEAKEFDTEDCPLCGKYVQDIVEYIADVDTETWVEMKCYNCDGDIYFRHRNVYESGVRE